MGCGDVGHWQACVILVQPVEKDGHTPFEKLTIIFCILYLFTLAAQVRLRTPSLET